MKICIRCFLVGTLIVASLLIVPDVRSAGAQDKVVFQPRTDEKYNAIREEVRQRSEEPEKTQMWVDFSAIPAPSSAAEFTAVWHQPSQLQGISGMCWSFSTTSLLESEIKRQTGRELKLSELHTVYWEYVEKARGFVQTRGRSFFGQGSQSEAVLRAWRNHGVVPGSAYTGLLPGRKNHDHERPLFQELKGYLETVKTSNLWNEEQVVAVVRAILDHHLGRPPEKVLVEGKEYTPKEYLEKVVRLNPDDYVAFLSTMEKPYGQRIEYEVPDNWWHSKEYLNIPLDDFLSAMKKAIRAGYSLAIAADMSEPGYSIGPPGIAVVADFDIPFASIDERARQFRFANKMTTDDHNMHLVGYLRQGDRDWYLIKDSWSSAWNNAHPGYYFFREDYLKLKVLSFLVHKDAVRDLLARERAR